MAISFNIQSPHFYLRDRNKVRQWIQQVIQLQNKKVGDIGYLFCTDDHLLSVNQQYLKHDTYTDIITFDYVEADLISGDILISTDRISENAKKYGVPQSTELHRVIIHGILHLLGNADKSDSEAAIMRKKEDDALSLWNSMFRVEHNG